ncbi:MAG: 3-methyl-2-oxobutanoate hydroxymethyltransferase, partial [Vulcanimicrobiaceae bacterium]
MARRITAGSLTKRKNAAFPVLTAYDAAFAPLLEQAGLDCILVGDSLANVVLGYASTVNLELHDMERHCAAVARSTDRAHIVGDLSFGSYEPDDATAVRSSVRLVQAGANSVKLEGGERIAARIAAIVAAGIPVMAHIGVTPQTAGLSDGFRTADDRGRLLADARAVEAVGAYAVVLEMVESTIAAEITQTLRIPTIGIGSGPDCDGQVLVLHDLLGLYPTAPPFAKRYADLGTIVTDAVKA